MKTITWVGVIAAAMLPLTAAYAQAPGPEAPGAEEQAPAAAPANLSPGAAEVVRLAGAGVGDDVMLAYINNSQAPFNLSADAVLYVKDLGLSPQVTSAMLSHDSMLRSQGQQYAPATTAPVAPPAAAPAVAPPTAPPTAVAAPAPTYVSSPPPDVSYFYNDLSPYGSWADLDGYGWCWQPQAVVISRGWRPYCDGGYWVYSDTGWYWQSDLFVGLGTVSLWALAVASPLRLGLAAGPGLGAGLGDLARAGDSCGWAPLPPHADFDLRLGWRFNGVRVGASFDFGLGVGAFAFVSLGDFCSHDLHGRCLPAARATTIYRQTTVVNNYVVNKNVVVNRGIPVERVAAASRVPVPRATVHDWRAAPDRMPTRGGAVVYRSQLHQPAPPVHMVAQKVDDRHPAIVHASVAPTRVEQRPVVNRSAPAPSAAQRSSPASSSKVSPWSSSPAQANPRSSQPTTTERPAPRAAPEWKQGTQSGPGYRSGPSTLTPSSAEPRNTHVYQPKGHDQYLDMDSASPSNQRQGESPGARGADSHSRKKD